MPLPRLRFAILASIFLALSPVLPLARAVSGQKQPLSLAPENRNEVNRLLQEYRSAGNDLQKKQEISLKVLAADPAAARLMLSAVERDLQPLLRKYSSKFQAQAAAAAKRKVGRVDPKRVLETRIAIHDLQKLGDGFTKQVIVEKIDPAVQRLRSAFILDPSEVLEKSPDLQTERKKLAGLGQIWEQCQARLPPSSGAESQTKATPVRFESYLRGEEELAALLAIPQDPRTRSVLAMNAKLSEKLDREEAQAILSLNLTRNLLGLPALVIDLRLCEAARGHSSDMERLKFFSHESPVAGKKTFGERAKQMGTTASGENIFAGASSGKSADEGWFHSPGHHRNQMGNFSRVGVGRSGTYFTQMFGS
jgi:uncharacterized protein YkwD